MFIVSNSGQQSHNWNLIGVTIKSNVMEEAPCFSWKSVHCSCPDSRQLALPIIDYTVQKFKNISWWQTDNCEVASPLHKFVHLSSSSRLITTDRAFPGILKASRGFSRFLRSGLLGSSRVSRSGNPPADAICSLVCIYWLETPRHEVKSWSEYWNGMHNAEAEYFNVLHSYQPLSLITTLDSVPATIRTMRWSLSPPTCYPDPAPGWWWWWCPAHWDCHQLAKIERALSL